MDVEVFDCVLKGLAADFFEFLSPQELPVYLSLIEGTNY